MRIYIILKMSILHRMKQKTSPTLSGFLDLVGRKAFQDRTGFSVNLVTRAKKDRVFPAHWFWKIRELCEDLEIEVPEHLFRGHPKAPVESHQRPTKGCIDPVGKEGRV